jgi:hypothetical protein
MMQQQIVQQLKQMTANLGLPAMTGEQQAAYDNLMKKYMDKAVSLYPVDEMISDMSALYQKHMSREDVDAFIAFYGSPAGQHLLEAQPAIMKEYMPIVMSRMQERSKALTDEMTKDIQDFAKSAGAGGTGTK